MRKLADMQFDIYLFLKISNLKGGSNVRKQLDFSEDEKKNDCTDRGNH
jgi:hypothetical protein